MPNSRIETSGTYNLEQLETLGCWVTQGNHLGFGGGNKLGSLDNYTFHFITNNQNRGGFRETGERFLTNPSGNIYSEYRELTKNLVTNDDSEDYIFRFYIPDKTMYKFSIDINYLSEDYLSWGNFERKIVCLRNNLNVTISKPTMNYTESTDKRIEAYWKFYGNELRFNVKGVSATNIVWTAKINYFGAYN